MGSFCQNGAEDTHLRRRDWVRFAGNALAHGPPGARSVRRFGSHEGPGG
jgi:hypothetical protein